MVFAVDLPSGGDPHAGEMPAEHVVADATVTLGALEPCRPLPPAAHAAGSEARFSVQPGRGLGHRVGCG